MNVGRGGALIQHVAEPAAHVAGPGVLATHAVTITPGTRRPESSARKRVCTRITTRVSPRPGTD